MTRRLARSASLGLAFSALCSLSEPHVAAACGALPCAQVNDVQPSDGASRVPTNTELRILYFGSLDGEPGSGECGFDIATLRVVPQGGEPIELRGTLFPHPADAQGWVVAKPDAPLSPDTRYEIQLEFGAGRDRCRCDGREWLTVSTFQTGADTDEAPPTFGGITALEYGARRQTSTNCGQTDGFPVLPTFTAPSDASPELRYNVYIDGEVGGRYLKGLGPTNDAAALFVSCRESSALMSVTQVSPGARLEARAVDIAGNESAAGASLPVSVACRPTQDGDGDGEDDGSDDADVSGPVTKEGDDGCSVSHGTRRGHGGVLASLMALGVVLSRRRRRRF